MKTFVLNFIFFFSIVQLLNDRCLSQIKWEVVRGGNNYSESTDSTEYAYNGISCTDENNCTAVGFSLHIHTFYGGYEHLIVRTTDGGKTWVKQNSGLPNFSVYQEAKLQSVWAVDSLHIYIAGDSGIFLRTSDGGTTWERKLIKTDYNMLYIYFYDKDNGILCGEHGTVAIAVKAGDYWHLREQMSETVFTQAIGLPGGPGVNDRWLVYDKFFGRQFENHFSWKFARPASAAPGSWEAESHRCARLQALMSSLWRLRKPRSTAECKS